MLSSLFSALPLRSLPTYLIIAESALAPHFATPRPPPKCLLRQPLDPCLPSFSLAFAGCCVRAARPPGCVTKVQVDDREQAASIMASHFPQIVLFIDEARNRGGVVYVHCGAGISRAPTVSEEHASRLRKTGPHGVYCVRSFAWLQSLSIVELGQNKTRLLS